MSKMSSDLANLEEYRDTTEKFLSESKQTIRALQSDLDKQKAEDAKKTARIKELEREQESMFGKDGEIQRLKKVCVCLFCPSAIIISLIQFNTLLFVGPG